MEVQRNVALTNWNVTEKMQAAVVAHARSVEDVVAVVRDRKAYPTPVLAVGTMHSVTGSVTNDGTVLSIAAMNKIIGLEGTRVRVETGVKLADLHDWLAQSDLEISFSPEIGDATVGSLVVSTSKDSSIDGPGYLSALVEEVTYVDERGDLVKITRKDNVAELLAFSCSYGMMGIVVEVVLQARHRIAVTTFPAALLAKTGAEAARKLAVAYRSCDALFAILVPGRNYVYLEQRTKTSKALAPLANNPAASLLCTLGINDVMRTTMVKVKYNCFMYGNPPSRPLALLLASNTIASTVHYRRTFVNRYPAVTAGTERLDFSFLEFDLSNFEQVVAECWEFHHEYKARTGYAPQGYGMYFVNRGWGKDAEGNPRKPSGSFAGPPGVSFMLDPITGDCDNPQWFAFNEEYTAWAVSRGATPSLSQTKGLKPGQAVLPRELTRERFLTKFFRDFVA